MSDEQKTSVDTASTPTSDTKGGDGGFVLEFDASDFTKKGRKRPPVNPLLAKRKLSNAGGVTTLTDPTVDTSIAAAASGERQEDEVALRSATDAVIARLEERQRRRSTSTASTRSATTARSISAASSSKGASSNHFQSPTSKVPPTSYNVAADHQHGITPHRGDSFVTVNTSGGGEGSGGGGRRGSMDQDADSRPAYVLLRLADEAAASPTTTTTFPDTLSAPTSTTSAAAPTSATTYASAAAPGEDAADTKSSETPWTFSPAPNNQRTFYFIESWPPPPGFLQAPTNNTTKGGQEEGGSTPQKKAATPKSHASPPSRTTPPTHKPSSKSQPPSPQTIPQGTCKQSSSSSSTTVEVKGGSGGDPASNSSSSPFPLIYTASDFFANHNDDSKPLIPQSSTKLAGSSTNSASTSRNLANLRNHKFIVLVFSSDIESGNLIQIERIGPYNYQMYTCPDCGNSPIQTNNKQWFHWSVRGLPANALVRVTLMGMANSKMYTFGWTPSVATVPLTDDVKRQLLEINGMGASSSSPSTSANGSSCDVPPDVTEEDVVDCCRHKGITNTFAVGSRGLSLDLARMDGTLEERITKTGIIAGGAVPPAPHTSQHPTTPFSADSYCAAAGVGLYPVLYTRMSNKHAKVVVTQLKDISMPTPGYPNLGYRQPNKASSAAAADDEAAPASPEKGHAAPSAEDTAHANPYEDDHDNDPRPKSRPNRGNTVSTILVGNVADPDPTGEGGFSNQALEGAAKSATNTVATDDGVNCFSSAVDKFSAEHERISAVTIIPPTTQLGDSMSTEPSVAGDNDTSTNIDPSTPTTTMSMETQHQHHPITGVSASSHSHLLMPTHAHQQNSSNTNASFQYYTPHIRSNSPPCTIVNVVGGTVEVLEQGAGQVHTTSSRVQRFLDDNKHRSTTHTTTSTRPGGAPHLSLGLSEVDATAAHTSVAAPSMGSFPAVFGMSPDQGGGCVPNPLLDNTSFPTPGGGGGGAGRGAALLAGLTMGATPMYPAESDPLLLPSPFLAGGTSPYADTTPTSPQSWPTAGAGGESNSTTNLLQAIASCEEGSEGGGLVSPPAHTPTTRDVSPAGTNAPLASFAPSSNTTAVAQKCGNSMDKYLSPSKALAHKKPPAVLIVAGARVSEIETIANGQWEKGLKGSPPSSPPQTIPPPTTDPTTPATKPKFPPSYSLSFELKADVDVPFIPTGNIEKKGLELAIKQHLQHHIAVFGSGGNPVGLVSDSILRTSLPPISPFQLGHCNCPSLYVAGALPYSYGRLCRHLLQWRRQVLTFNENLRITQRNKTASASSSSPSSVGIPCPILLTSPYDAYPVPLSSSSLSTIRQLTIPNGGIYYNEELLCKSLDGHDVHLLTITGVTSEMNRDFDKMLVSAVLSSSSAKNAPNTTTSTNGGVSPPPAPTPIEAVEGLLKESMDKYNTSSKLRDLTFSILPQEPVVEDTTTARIPATGAPLRPIAFPALPEQRFTSSTSSSSRGESTKTTMLSEDDSAATSGIPSSFQKFFIVFTCRVHPGETPASYMLHGSLDFFLHPTDPRAAQLRAQCVLIVVPMINPDGVARGHSRVDANGIDLNRMYKDPTFAQNPAPYSLRGMLLRLASGDMPVLPNATFSSSSSAFATPSFSPYGATPPPPPNNTSFTIQQHATTLTTTIPPKPKLKRLHLFIDMHAHANKKGTFFYGNSMNASHMARSLLYSKLIAINSPYFEFPACNFSEANMFAVGRTGKSKDLSSRVTIFQDSGVVHIYTIEANYVAGAITNWITDVPLAPSTSSTSTSTSTDDASPTTSLPDYAPSSTPSKFEPSLLRTQFKKQQRLHASSTTNRDDDDTTTSATKKLLPIVGTYGRVFIKLTPGTGDSGAEGAIALLESTVGPLQLLSSAGSHSSSSESAAASQAVISQLNGNVDNLLHEAAIVGRGYNSNTTTTAAASHHCHDGVLCTVTSNSPGAERTLASGATSRTPAGSAVNPKAGTKYDTHIFADIGRALLVSFLDLSSATPPPPPSRQQLTAGDTPHSPTITTNTTTTAVQLHPHSRIPLTTYKTVESLHTSLARFLLFDAFEAMRKQIMLRCKLNNGSFFDIMGIQLTPKKKSSVPTTSTATAAPLSGVAAARAAALRKLKAGSAATTAPSTDAVIPLSVPPKRAPEDNMDVNPSAKDQQPEASSVVADGDASLVVEEPSPLLSFKDLPVVYTHRGSKTFPPTSIHRLSTLVRFLPLVSGSGSTSSVVTTTTLSPNALGLPTHPFHKPEAGGATTPRGGGGVSSSSSALSGPPPLPIGAAVSTTTHIPVTALSLRTGATVDMLLE